MGQMQRNHECRRKRQVFAVEERLGVQPGMQQEHQQGQQGQPAAAERPIDQQAAEETSGDEQQMAQQMAEQVDVTKLLQAESSLDQEQRHLERHAIKAIAVIAQIIESADLARQVLDGGDGETALLDLVEFDAVVVQHRNASQCEQHANRQGQRRKRDRLRQANAAKPKAGAESRASRLQGLHWRQPSRFCRSALCAGLEFRRAHGAVP